MQDALYDTSWIVHSIPKLTSSLSRLLSSPSATRRERDAQDVQFSSHAHLFLESLKNDRPRYEREEEKEKLGGLKRCTWTRLEHELGGEEFRSRDAQAGKKRKGDIREDGDEEVQSGGLSINLVYEKKAYSFILYTSLPSDGSSTSSKRQRTNAPTTRKKPSNTAALLLSKSSPAALKAVINFFSAAFQVEEINPLKLSPTLLQTSLEKYLATTYRALLIPKPHSVDDAAAVMEKSPKVFNSVIGTTKLTISFSAPIAPSLKALEIALPPETVLKMCRRSAADGVETRPKATENRAFFLDRLAEYILIKTGLFIPTVRTKDRPDTSARLRTSFLQDKDIDHDDNEDAAEQHSRSMKITRISTASYAISTDARLKFVSRAVEAVGSDEHDRGQENCVRRANRDLLGAVLDEVSRQGRDEG